MRYPRVFYTECNTVKDYDEVDSKLNAIINKIRYETKYDQSNFVQSYLCDDGRYLLILQDKVLMVRVEEDKISWSINMDNFILLKNDTEKKQLEVKDMVESTFSVKFWLMIENVTQCEDEWWWGQRKGCKSD